MPFVGAPRCVVRVQALVRGAQARHAYRAALRRWFASDGCTAGRGRRRAYAAAELNGLGSRLVEACEEVSSLWGRGCGELIGYK